MDRFTRNYGPWNWTVIALMVIGWLICESADFGLRLGAFTWGKSYMPYVSFDSIPIDTLRTSLPGIHVHVLGVELNRLYPEGVYPFHVRVRACWSLLLPAIVIFHTVFSKDLAAFEKARRDA